MLKWIGRIWAFPVALPIWLFYILPFWALGLLKYQESIGGVFIFNPVLKWGWYAYLWDGWGGHGLPYCIIIKEDWFVDCWRHEYRHTDQWLILGILFPIVYVLGLIFFGYIKHPLEIDADRWMLQQMGFSGEEIQKMLKKRGRI